jgi:uncharacterized protein YjbI with pentapeptide repeats
VTVQAASGRVLDTVTVEARGDTRARRGQGGLASRQTGDAEYWQAASEAGARAVERGVEKAVRSLLATPAVRALSGPSDDSVAPLRGRDLAGKNLRGADLRRADLRDADLTRADLTGGDLSNADLAGATLTLARLAGANLTGASLKHARLEHADLSKANLNGASLSGADLTRADLGRATLVGTRLDGAVLRGAGLSGARMDAADLRDADLSHADLDDASLTDADLRGATLVDADLEGARLGGARLERADLRRTDVRRADFRGARFGLLESPGCPASGFPEAALAELWAAGRDEILRWCEPVGRFLDTRIVAYGLDRHRDGVLAVDAYGAVTLVLGFDAEGRLENLGLVSAGKADFLLDGQTTKREVLGRLGRPSAQFEGERILTYRLDQDRRTVEAWRDAHHSLVLVFDAAHVLSRHRVVPLRQAGASP